MGQRRQHLFSGISKGDFNPFIFFKLDEGALRISVSDNIHSLGDDSGLFRLPWGVDILLQVSIDYAAKAFVLYGRGESNTLVRWM
jgi:hypothetical protein